MRLRPGRARHGDVGRYGRPRGWMGLGYPLEERVSHAGSFSGSYWCPHRGVVILGRQRGCGVSWGLAVAQVPFPVLWPPARLGCDVGMWGFGEGVRIGWLG